MKFKFPLQKVLEHRKINENIAQKEFQDALAVLQALKTTLAKMVEMADQARLRSHGLQREGGAASPGLQQIDHFLQNQKILVSQQQQKINEQEAIVEGKRSSLLQAAVDTKVIATLKEKKFEEFKLSEEKKEQNETDEQSVLRFKGAERRNDSN